MCIAILNQKNVLSRETLKSCWESNNDGAGFACVKDGRIYIHKEMKNFDSFYKEYEAARKSIDSKFLIHFRIATQGEKTELNCHPFQVSEHLAFIHNGMLREMPHHQKYSDTYLLNSLFLSKFKDGFEKLPDFLDTMKVFAGTFSNKLVFLNADNEHFIVNENQGHWKDGDWFSNYSYNRCNKPTSTIELIMP